ncbi:AMIN-like domain-containing (lipo)protein [Saccharopolyspora sp. NPDC002376]
MSLRSKLILAVGTMAVSALAVTGCSAGAQPVSPESATAPQQVQSLQSGAAGTSSLASSFEAPVSTDKPGMRAGVHGNEERVVFDFSGLSDVNGIKVMNHELNEKSPVWGGSGEPVEGMTGTKFLHIYVEVADPERRTASPETFDQPLAKSAVVNDNSHGTGELTIGLSEGVDYEVLVEGEKVIVNMSAGPLGR